MVDYAVTSLKSLLVTFLSEFAISKLGFKKQVLNRKCTLAQILGFGTFGHFTPRHRISQENLEAHRHVSESRSAGQSFLLVSVLFSDPLNGSHSCSWLWSCQDH